MPDLDISLDIRIPQGTARWAMAGLLLALLAPDLATESVTLTTYYPAPTVFYGQLVSVSNAYLAPDGGSNVGIGTTNPTAELDVSNSIRFGPTLGAQGELASLGGNPALNSTGSYPLVFSLNNGAVKTSIDSSGNLGLGTISPVNKLEINGNLAFTAGPGIAKICQNVPYSNGGYTACPASNFTPVQLPYGAYSCSEGTRGSQPCAFPESGNMLCCRLAP